MSNYNLLWECFMSDQMTAMQLEQHMKDDPEFKTWVENKLRELREEEEECSN